LPSRSAEQAAGYADVAAVKAAATMQPVSKVHVREFSMADHDAVLGLWQGAGAGVPVRPSDGPDGIRLKLTRDPDLFLVACAGEEIVGTVMGGWDGRRAYLYHLTVRPDHRRQGVATRLLEAVEDRMRARGALKVKCQVFVDNAAALAFFRARNYEVEVGLHPVGKELVPGGAPPVGAPPEPRAGGLRPG
jgi:ribosomal protein S18 acetylase RimI-like enzyme